MKNVVFIIIMIVIIMGFLSPGTSPVVELTILFL